MTPKLCKRCHSKETSNGKYKFCSDCKQAIVEVEESRPSCKKEGCTKKALMSNAYCGTHKLLAWKEEVELRGKKVCSNYIRSCREELDMSYPKQKCAACLEEEREKEKKRTADKKAILPERDDEGNKLCSSCLKYHPVGSFEGVKGEEVKRCQGCRDQNKKADANRDKEHRNALDRVAAQRPGRKATKQEWAKYNYDKVLMKDRKYKAKTMLQDLEGTLQKGREKTVEFRAKNPEKMKEANEKRRMSKEASYRVYKNSAGAKNLAFECTQAWFFETIQKPCHYCGSVDERGFNGVDRLNCHMGYTEENGVPCCSMCNKLKASLTENVFLMRVEHMCTHGGWVEGRRWPGVFPDSLGSLLSGVKARANQLKVEFDLTPVFFEEMHQRGCYLCGKVNTEKKNSVGRKFHRNGTDRVLNSEGYVMTNVRPCCGECNYMKKDYSLDLLHEKLRQIYEYRNIGAMDFDSGLKEVGIRCLEPHLKKVTKEEKVKIREEKKKVKIREEKKKAKLAKLGEEWPELVPTKGLNPI